MDTPRQKAVARAAAALESIHDDRERAQAAIDITAEARRIRHAAFVELKKTHTFAAIGAMFGITGARVDQIIRQGDGSEP